MELEVVVPVPAAIDFNFDSACSSPYITAPSSPQRFGNFFCSAPTSPTRASSFYRHFNNLETKDFNIKPSSTIPFGWEEKPGIPKINSPKNGVGKGSEEEEEDFAFDFSGQLERTSLSAEELFDGGKIKPLKPPPRLQFVGGGGGQEFELGLNDSNNSKNSVSSPRSPRSPFSQGKKMFREALSPRQKKDYDPFAAAIEETTRNRGGNTGLDQQNSNRGRGRISDSSSSNYARKGTRSVSPLRVSDLMFRSEENSQTPTSPATTTTTTTKITTSSSSSNAVASFLNSISLSKGNRKWKLKDFLLFRSASEGRATDKDPLNKYVALSKKSEDVKNSSFRSTDSSGSVSSSRRRGPVSAHEMHYAANRAASEEMKRKTFLPYKQGLLGCLGFNPTMQEISKGLGL